jgi:GT2 family glycosyltransferase
MVPTVSERGTAVPPRAVSPRVTVVIPNWNGERFLEICLGSLRTQTFRDFKTLLVDNGSSDGSVAFVEENFPEVRVVRLPENLGFSAAVNAGIKASKADLVALLNNDTEVDPGWLEALVRAADDHPEAGFFASKLVDYRDRRLLDGAGDALRRSGLPYRLGHGEIDRGQFEREAFVFSACAAAALYRREMLNDIGLFDEDFFSNCEDWDVGFRAQLAGYRCVYVPGSVVYHVGSASTGGQKSALNTRLGAQNGVNVLVKNLPATLTGKTLPFIIAGLISRLTVTALSPGLLRAYLSGLVGAGRLLPTMLKKRREIQKRRRVSDDYVMRLLRESSRHVAASRLRRIRDWIALHLSR